MSVDELKRRFDELAARDERRVIFGASSHGYRLRPPCPEAELAQRERAHGYALPEDYREFITRIGNGGAGPSYGVLPFLGKDSEDYTEYERLGTPWAYADTYNPIGVLSPDDEDDEDDDAIERGQRAYWRAFSSAGALYLCDHGCASRSLLVVSGPARGQVWADEVANEGGYAPAVTAAGERHTFTTWFAAWLDRSFAELAKPRG